MGGEKENMKESKGREREVEKGKGKAEGEGSTLVQTNKVKVCWMESALQKCKCCNMMILCHHLSTNLQP